MKLKLKSIAALCGLFASVSGASATNLPNPLGENYFGFGAGYGWISGTDLDGWIVGTGLNHNIQAGPDLGMDLTFVYNYSRLTDSPLRATGHQIAGSYTFFTETQGVKPFLSLDLSYTWARARMGGFSASDNSWQWGFTGGAEFGVGEFTITPFLGWSRDQGDGRESHWFGGVNGHYWLTDTMGLGLGYHLTEGPNRSHTVLLTVGFRY